MICFRALNYEYPEENDDRYSDISPVSWSPTQGSNLLSLLKLYTYGKQPCSVLHYSPKQNTCVTFDITGKSDLISGILEKKILVANISSKRSKNFYFVATNKCTFYLTNHVTFFL